MACNSQTQLNDDVYMYSEAIQAAFQFPIEGLRNVVYFIELSGALIRGA